jgi:hypothetical protein
MLLDHILYRLNPVHTHILIFNTAACPFPEIESPEMVFKEYIETYAILRASISTFHPIWDSSFRKQKRQNAKLNIGVLA